MAEDLEALAGRLLRAAQAAGADAADALAVAGDSLSIEVRNGALEQAERAEGVDLGLRVLIGRRQACVSSSDIRDATIAAMAERAVAMAREAPEDPWCGLAAPEELARGWDAAALDLEDRAPCRRPTRCKAAALGAEAAALAVPGVSKMDAAGASWSAGRMHLAASNGFSGGYARTGHSLQAVAICGDGTAMERDYAAESRVHRADLPEPEEIGRLAGERTAARAGAGKPPTGAWPVLYDERVAAGADRPPGAGDQRLRHRPRRELAQGRHGRAGAARRASTSSRIRSARASPARGPSTPRGCRWRRRALVAAGVLRSWTLDLATARQLGLASTGNAGRGTSSPPSPSAGNLALTPGQPSAATSSWPRWAPGSSSPR